MANYWIHGNVSPTGELKIFDEKLGVNAPRHGDILEDDYGLFLVVKRGDKLHRDQVPAWMRDKFPRPVQEALTNFYTVAT